MKILLIEDNTERQEKFMESFKIELSSLKYSTILNNAVKEKYFEVYRELESDTFDFDNYSIIMAHKSAFRENANNEEVIKKLEKGSKVLVLFSGGIDANYYVKTENVEILELNSKTFYSNNLLQFLSNVKDANILSLCYGDNWKLNIALNIIEEINRFINETDDKEIDCEDIVSTEDKEILDEIDVELYAKINNTKAIRNDLINTRDKILSYIDERLLYE